MFFKETELNSRCLRAAVKGSPPITLKRSNK